MQTSLKIQKKTVLHPHLSLPLHLNLQSYVYAVNQFSIMNNFYKNLICMKTILGLMFYRSSAFIFEIIEAHRVKVLPPSDESPTSLLIRHKHGFYDALQKASKHGMAFTCPSTYESHLLVKWLLTLENHLPLIFIAQNNKLFSGPSTAYTPNHNIIEMQKQTFYYVGMFFCIIDYPWWSSSYVSFICCC